MKDTLAGRYKMPGEDVMDAAPCAGQDHGHNFVGDVCTNQCGTRQSDLRKKRPVRTMKPVAAGIKKPVQGMHSSDHAAAKEISEWCGEPKNFGMFLGVIKRIGRSRAYQVVAQMKQMRDPIKKRGPYFMACARSNAE